MGAYAVDMTVQLTRPWTCDACGRRMRKGTTVRVHIEAGEPHNRVTHVECPPKVR